MASPAQRRLSIGVLALSRGVLHAEHDDFLFTFIKQMVNEISAARRHELTHAALLLRPADTRKQHETLKSIVDGRPDALRG